VMASTSSLPALPASTARSWWKTSPWRDAEEPQAGPCGLGRPVREDPPPADLQDPMEWRSSGDRRPLVPLLQDVLGLSGSKNQTAAPDASVQQRNVWPGPGSATAASAGDAACRRITETH
jgi:hypothetical protein